MMIGVSVFPEVFLSFSSVYLLIIKQFINLYLGEVTELLLERNWDISREDC